MAEDLLRRRHGAALGFVWRSVWRSVWRFVWRFVWALAAAALVGLGCVGNIAHHEAQAAPEGTEDPYRQPIASDDNAEHEAQSLPPYDPNASPASCEPSTDPGPNQLRRLTREEYNNTLTDLLSQPVRVGDAFPPDESLDGFASSAVVSPVQVELYAKAARELATSVSLDFVGCDVSQGLSCAETFLKEQGIRFYRRLMSDAEVARLLDIYALGADPDESFRLMLELMLQSPNLLYIPEFGHVETDGAVVVLTDFELATRLSYLLWATTPDEALLDLARRGELSQPTVLEEQTRRMLDDGRAHQALVRFFEQWLGLQLKQVVKSESVYPQWTPELQHQVEKQRDLFLTTISSGGAESFERLWQSQVFPSNEALAAVYGGEAVTGQQLQLADFGTRRAAGVLALPAFLAAHANPDRSSPVKRGVTVRRQILCGALPPPPDDVDLTQPEPTDGVSTREVAEQHRADPACAGCHQLIDPLGFGFEHFDSIGRYREADQGVSVDATGEVFGTTSIDGTFDGLPELAVKLAQSHEVKDCAAQMWFRFSMGRAATSADTCVIQRARGSLASSGDVHEMVVETILSPAFMSKRRENL